MALYAFDGTWNDSSAPDDDRDQKKDTNVHRFRVLYGERVFYESGVGTRYGIIGKLIGGATGTGAKARIDENFEKLERRFAEGDTTIDIIGYSRGAATARMFVHRIQSDFRRLKPNGVALTRPPVVRFLGLFDTVASFGLPWTENEHDFRVEISAFVENCFHAMALDETRENFGIERCLGDRDKITEVWFRGGHGDIGGNATYVGFEGEQSNRKRSDIALNWMLAKANACGLPVPVSVHDSADDISKERDEAPVTALDEPVSIGNAGTLSRRIHIGDLMHYTVEQTELTRGIDGRLLRRIDVPTRIEDVKLACSAKAHNWIPPASAYALPDNLRPSEDRPSLVRLSLRRYPFDVLPARTWDAWLSQWKLQDSDIAHGRDDEFWAPSAADRALAWDLMVEMKTRIVIQPLKDDEGDDKTALTSVSRLFDASRSFMHQHGVECANTATLINGYLNKYVRPFTAKWHKVSEDQKWVENSGAINLEFRRELRDLQPWMNGLVDALSQLADAQL